MSNAPYGRQLWSPEEDAKLREIMATSTNIVWTEIATKFKNRTGKQCRERWVNHLNPEINEREWTTSEDEQLFNLHSQIGNKWASIAKHMPGRSENSIKNRWYSSIKKRVMIDPITGHPVLRDPISRGRAKKMPFDIPFAMQRKPFSSVPLMPIINQQIQRPYGNFVPQNSIIFIDPHSSVPIAQKKPQAEVPVGTASLMPADFSPRNFAFQAPNPVQKLPSAIVPVPTIGSSPEPVAEPPKAVSNVVVSRPNHESKQTNVLSVTSLMNPNFPPKIPQPTVIRHNAKVPTHSNPK